MRARVAIVTLLVCVAGCASRRAAVGGVTAAAAAAAIVGCAASSSSCSGVAPAPLSCPRGYVLGIDSRCHREN